MHALHQQRNNNPTESEKKKEPPPGAGWSSDGGASCPLRAAALPQQSPPLRNILWLNTTTQFAGEECQAIGAEASASFGIIIFNPSPPQEKGANKPYKGKTHHNAADAIAAYSIRRHRVVGPDPELDQLSAQRQEQRRALLQRNGRLQVLPQERRTADRLGGGEELFRAEKVLSRGHVPLQRNSREAGGRISP